jgi:hypothetical protein
MEISVSSSAVIDSIPRIEAPLGTESERASEAEPDLRPQRASGNAFEAEPDLRSHRRFDLIPSGECNPFFIKDFALQSASPARTGR